MTRALVAVLVVAGLVALGVARMCWLIASWHRTSPGEDRGE